MCWNSVTSILGGSHIYFRYNATSGDIVDNTIEQLDLENMGIAVGILLLCALELEIWFKPQMTTDSLHTSGFFAPPHWTFGTWYTNNKHSIL